MCKLKKRRRGNNEPPQTQYVDEPNDTELSKTIDCYAASMFLLLRVEIELLVEAKEQAISHTYQSYMQEERLTLIDREIANLSSYKEELQQQLSAYKSETEKVYQENQHRLEGLLAANNELAAIRLCLDTLKLIFNKAKAFEDKLQNDWKIFKKSRSSGLQTPTKETEHTAEPPKPASILKSFENPSISPKTIKFREGPIVRPMLNSSSVDVPAASGSQQSNSAENMLEKLFASRKRPRQE